MRKFNKIVVNSYKNGTIIVEVDGKQINSKHPSIIELQNEPILDKNAVMVAIGEANEIEIHQENLEEIDE